MPVRARVPVRVLSEQVQGQVQVRVGVWAATSPCLPRICLRLFLHLDPSRPSLRLSHPRNILFLPIDRTNSALPLLLHHLETSYLILPHFQVKEVNKKCNTSNSNNNSCSNNNSSNNSISWRPLATRRHIPHLHLLLLFLHPRCLLLLPVCGIPLFRILMLVASIPLLLRMIFVHPTRTTVAQWEAEVETEAQAEAEVESEARMFDPPPRPLAIRRGRDGNLGHCNRLG